MAVGNSKTFSGADRALWLTLAAALIGAAAVGYFDRWQSGVVVAAAIYVLVHEIRSERDVRSTLVGLALMFALVAYLIALVSFRSVGR
jgi:hypothetical protein